MLSLERSRALGLRSASTEGPPRMTPGDREISSHVGVDQTQFARAPVECLGREEAIHACQANGWRGLLDLILVWQELP